MKNIIMIIAIFAIFTGCIAKNANNEVVGIKGIISGATYKPELLVDMYQVVSKGIVSLMTKEQIKAMKLDKVDIAIKYVYSVTIDGKKIVKKDVALDLDSNTSL